MTPNSKQQVIDLINTDNHSSFTVNDLTFGLPTPNSDPVHVHNTAVPATSTNGIFTGTVTLYYDRLDLAILFSGADLNFAFSHNYVTTHDLIPLLNSRFALTLEPADLIDEALVLPTTFPKPQVIKAHADSLAFRGQVTISLVKPQPVTVVSAGEVASAFVGWTLDSPLQDGAFITSEDLNPSRSGEVMVGARARVSSDFSAPTSTKIPDNETPPAAGEDLYSLAIDGLAGNWMIDLGAKMASYPLGSRIEDLYDIQLRFFHSNLTAGQLVYHLQYVGGVYQFFNSAYSHILPVNYNNGSDLITTSIDMKLLATSTGWTQEFGEVPTTANGVPYRDNALFPGWLGFQITATGKEDIDGQDYVGPDVSSSFVVDVAASANNPWLSPVTAPSTNTFEEGFKFNGDWFVTTDWSTSGVNSLRSADVGDSQTSSTSVDLVDGTNVTFSFDYKTDCEQDYDFLQLWINEANVWQISGANEAHYSTALTAGPQHIEWRYAKDDSQSAGADAAWIDNVKFALKMFGRGYFFSNTYFTAGTKDFTTYTAASPSPTDTNAPSLPNRSIMVVGPDQQLMTFEPWGGTTVRLLSLYPGDTEWGVDFLPLLSNLVASTSTQRDMAVFFKGFCYVVGIENATGHWALFRINVDNTSGRVHTAELVYRMLNDGAPTLLIASETKLVMLVDDSTINFTDDGVNWTRQVIMHPYGGHDGNPSNPPALYLHGLALKGDLLVGMGNSSYATGVANIIFFNGTVGGSYTWYQTAPYAFDYDYDWRVCNMLYIQDKVYLMLSEVYDNAGSPGLGSAGDILVSPDDGATWSVVRRGTGVYQGRMLWDGTTFAAYGSKDSWPTAGRYLVYTQDFVDWTDVDDDSGYYSDKYPRTAIHMIAYPEILAYTPLSVAVPAFIDPVIPITYTPNGTIRKMVIREDGKLLIGGNQVQYTSMTDSSTIAVSYLSLASSDLVPDQTFTPQFSDIVMDFDRQGNTGKLIVVGHFNTAGGSSYPKIAQLNADGSLDTSFAAVDWDNGTAALERPTKVKYLSDGKILACGTVILVNGVSKPGMVRFNADGTVDSAFTAALTPNAAQPSAVSVYFMHVLSTGKIIITGAFTGNAKVLNADGTVERELDIGVGDNLNGNISDVYEYPDGRILLFGSDMVFNSVTGLASIRFNSDWTHDATWAGSSRMGIQAQPIRLPTDDGFIVVGKGSGGEQGAVVVDDTGAYVRDYSYVYGTGPYLSAALAADGSLYMAASPLRKGAYPREQNASSSAQVIHALPAS